MVELCKLWHSQNKQPLSLSHQSEIVCQKLHLEDEVLIVQGSRGTSSTGHVQEVLGVGANRSEGDGRTEKFAVPTEAPTNRNMTGMDYSRRYLGSNLQ